jgi:hypothetical protein
LFFTRAWLPYCSYPTAPRRFTIMPNPDTYSAKIAEMQKQLEELQRRREEAEAQRQAETERLEREEREAADRLAAVTARKNELLAIDAQESAVTIRRKQELETGGEYGFDQARLR